MRSFLIAAAFLSAAAFSAADKPLVFPSPLVDRAQLLRPEESRGVLRFIEKLNASEKVQLAVYISDSLQDQDIETYSVDLFEKWKLGKKGIDNGLLLVIAPNERRMRLEVGYGLEGDIPDITAKRIVSDGMAPYFRQGRFGDGILVALELIAKHTQIDLKAPVDNRIYKRKGDPAGPLVFWLFLALLLVVFVIGAMGSGGRRRRGWDDWGGGGWGGGGGDWGGGGGWGGGGFGGGGGSSGGGGASGSW